MHGVKCVFPLSPALTFEDGALIDPASIALHVANRGNITPGDTVAITGAGAIGLLAGDAARIRGAARVIIVGRGHRLAKAAAMGFETVDTARGNPVVAVRELTGGFGADVALECAGVPETIEWALGMLRRGGRCAAVGIPTVGVEIAMQRLVLDELELVGSRASAGEMRRVMPHVEQGRMRVREMVTHRFPLADYAEALATFNDRASGAIKIIVSRRAARKPAECPLRAVGRPQHVASVDVDDGSGDEPTAVAAEPRDRLGDVTAVAHRREGLPAEGAPGRESAPLLLLGEAAQLGRDDAGPDHVDADAVAAEIEGECPAHRLDGSLAGHVAEPPARRPADDGRAEVDHHAPAPPELAKRGPRAQEHADGVGAQHPDEVVLGEPVDGCLDLAAGVVHEHVDSAERGHGRVDHGPRVRVPRHVRHERDHPARPRRGLPGQAIEPVAAACRREDLGAEAGEMAGGVGAEATRRARDDDLSGLRCPWAYLRWRLPGGPAAATRLSTQARPAATSSARFRPASWMRSSWSSNQALW